MRFTARAVIASVACCVLLSAARSNAETILRLNLGNSNEANFAYSGGVFSTLDDGSNETTGHQNATIEYMNLPSPAMSSLALAQPSFTLTGVNASAPSQTFSGALVVQDLSNGTLAIYGDGNELLLSASITIGAVTGALGPPNTQGLFLASGEVTGGSMADGLDPSSLRVKVKLPTVGGFAVSPMPSTPPPPVYTAPLQPFTATSLSVEILAAVVPEPAAIALLVAGFAACLAATGRRKPYGR